MRQPLLDGALHSRIKGRAQLVRRMRGLLVAVHRFGRGRACTPADLRWAAMVIDGLTALLHQGDSDATHEPR